MTARGLSLQPLLDVPLVAQGDDLVRITLEALQASGLSLQFGDVIVFAQKVVSKAEGRSVDLRTIVPSAQATELAAVADKDPRLVELILSESTEVVRARPGVIVVEHRLGIILANAGIDRSNVADDNHALLLPLDPDGSARAMRSALKDATGVDVGILIIDSIGRAWRNGTIGTTIGASGIPTLLDLRGRPDLFGHALQTTEVGWSDELAAAASLVMGQAGEGCPIVLARGLAAQLNGSLQDHPASDLLRPRVKDMFR